MNYTPGKLFADCTHRYQVVAAAPTPEPRSIQQSATELSTFMCDIIQTRLLPALANFPEALEAYSATLRQLFQEYALTRP